MIVNLQAVIIVLMWTSTAVNTLDNYGYRECVHNKYQAVCLGKAEWFSREGRGLNSFPSIPSKATCVILKSNYIEQFPGDVSSLTNVVTLDLSGNRLSYLPDDLYKMQQLEILDVSENRLETLSPNTKFPESLRGLLLAKNNMKRIPNGIRVPGLLVLDLSHNLFTEIPEQFCISDQLIRVDFTRNPLQHDVSRDISKVNRCKNINDIPFCLFTTETTIKCDCSSLGPLLQDSPSFCMGAQTKYQEFTCSSNSVDKYKTKKIFDLNVTVVKDACPHEFLAQQKSISAKNGLDTNVALVIPLLLFLCLS